MRLITKENEMKQKFAQELYWKQLAINCIVAETKNPKSIETRTVQKDPRLEALWVLKT